MARPVRRHPSFFADYSAILAWLEKHGEREWIVVLLRGLEDVVRMLAELPGVGARMAAREPIVMRKILFPKGPYVAWYAYDSAAAEGEVWLLRLFHARQKRPKPDLGRWLKGGKLPR